MNQALIDLGEGRRTIHQVLQQMTGEVSLAGYPGAAYPLELY